MTVQRRDYTCPTCHMVKGSFTTPWHRHDGQWVAFVLPVPVDTTPEPVKRGPGRPRKTPVAPAE